MEKKIAGEKGGAAGNLGAMDLHGAAQTLEQALKNGAASLDATAFTQALAEILASVAALEPAAPGEAEGPEYACERCNWRHAQSLIRELRRLMEESEFVPAELIEELKSSVACRPLQGKLTQLGRHIDGLDYKAGLRVLNELDCAEGHDLRG